MIAKEKAEAIRKAKQYLDTCKDNYTAAMHCDDDTFRKAARTSSSKDQIANFGERPWLTFSKAFSTG